MFHDDPNIAPEPLQTLRQPGQLLGGMVDLDRRHDDLPTGTADSHHAFPFGYIDTYGGNEPLFHIVPSRF
jgi:hypothetical protein